jgi:SAM-dependent methyltransferase
MSRNAVAQDSINRTAYCSRSALRWYGNARAWVDRGEQAALEFVADKVRDQPILDVGVGGGRTVPIMRSISTSYTAVDYTPELVQICQRNFPDVRVLQMDARDMSSFSDESFALVMFSFNGIDSVDYEGRCAILREFSRVLRPGGFVVFSTHNLQGPSYRENVSVFLRLPQLSTNPLSVGVDTARVLYSLPIAAFNYIRYSKLNREYDGYAVRVCAAHKFGTVLMYTDIATQRRQLANVGLVTDAVFGNTKGAPLNENENDVSSEYWCHFVARKP